MNAEKKFAKVITSYSAASASTSDALSVTVPWHGGRGYISVGSINEDGSGLNLNVSWQLKNLDVQSDLNGQYPASSVLNETPATQGVLYQFEAPAGDIIVGLSPASSGVLAILDVIIFW